MDNLEEQIKSLKCSKHPNKRNNNIIVISYQGLNGKSGPVLQCEHCIDEQEDDQQKILTSIKRFLDIQKLELGIN